MGRHGGRVELGVLQCCLNLGQLGPLHESSDFFLFMLSVDGFQVVSRNGSERDEAASDGMRE